MTLVAASAFYVLVVFAGETAETIEGSPQPYLGDDMKSAMSQDFCLDMAETLNLDMSDNKFHACVPVFSTNRHLKG